MPRGIFTPLFGRSQRPRSLPVCRAALARLRPYLLLLMMAPVLALARPASGSPERGVAAQYVIYNLDASFVGPTSVHVSYRVENYPCSYAFCDYLLTVQPPTGAKQVLASLPNVPLGSHTFAGTFRDDGPTHAGLAPGTYTYRTEIQSYNTDHTPAGNLVIEAKDATVSGNSVQGTLLFDETLTGALTLNCTGPLTVSAGRTLTLGSVQLSQGSGWNCGIAINGTLVVAADAQTGGIPISLYKPHTFSKIHGAQLRFEAGSQGSSVDQSSQLGVWTAVPMSLTKIEGLDLTVENPQGLVEVSGAKGLSTSYMLLRADSHVHLRDSEFTGAELHLYGPCASTICPATEGDFSAARLTFVNPLTIAVGFGAGATFQDTRFRGEVTLGSDTGHSQFEGSEFAGGLTLVGNSDTVFRRNVFAGSLYFDGWCASADTPRPVVENNSFVGAVAAAVNSYNWSCTTPLAFGPNYYGDKGGPATPDRNGFLRRGAYLAPAQFAAAPALSTGSQRSDTGVNPQVWLHKNGNSGFYRVTQNVLAGWGISPNLVRGKQTLVSLDLMTSDQTVNGVNVWAIFGGTKVLPTTGESVTLHRDARDYGRVGNDWGLSTVNFILPAAETGSSTFEVWVDTTHVQGYTGQGAVWKLDGLPTGLYFQAGPPRKLQVLVIPVQLPTGIGNTGPTIGAIETLLPAMTPIARDQIQVREGLVLNHGSYWTTTGLLNELATGLAARQAFLNSYAATYHRPADVTDFIVAVMPAGSMGAGVDGASMALRRGVVFVDSAKPDAVIHEMGHAIGLYGGREQYQWPNYPDNGLPLYGMTAFLGQPSTTSDKINQIFRGTDAGRIRHLPAETDYWADPTPQWYDIMGVGINETWIDPGTAAAFATYFAGLSATPAQSQSDPAPAVADAAGSGAAGMRTLAIYGQTKPVQLRESSNGRACLGFVPDPATMRVTEMAGPGGLTQAARMAGSRDGPAMAAPAAYPPGTLLPCNDAVGMNYYVRWYDANNARLGAMMLFNDILGRDPFRQVDGLFTTLTVEAQMARLEIAPTYEGPAVFSVGGSGTLTTQITAPASNATLGPTVTVSWQNSGPAPVGQPLQHLLEYSADGGVTWQAAGLPVEGQQAVLPTGFLPISDNLTLRVTSSDGVRTAAGQVTGLKRPNSAPQVTIVAPVAGAQGQSEATWTLQASAYDAEDGALQAGAWTSSLDGPLGQGPVLSGLHLSAGAHTLIYSVADSLGAVGTAQVEVTAGPQPTVDLGLEPNALEVGVPQRDPSAGPAVTLRYGLPHTLGLQMNNTGRVVTATLSLYVTPPGQAEQLLGQQTRAMAPFERVKLSLAYRPALPGNYHFRGELSNIAPADTNPANNSRGWDYTAAAPSRLADPPSLLGIGNGALGMPHSQLLTLTNAGGADLLIQSLAISGAQAGQFAFWNNGCSLASLGAGQSCSVLVTLTASTLGPLEAQIEITSTDAERPTRTLTLTGTGIAPKKIYLPMLRRSN